MRKDEKTASEISTGLKLFGLKPKTNAQKRFMRWFIIIKTIVYLTIFACVIVLLLRINGIKA